MGFGEAPPLPDWYQPSAKEVSPRSESSAEQVNERLRSEGFETSRAASAKPAEQGTMVENQGQIKQMVLPADWQEATKNVDPNVLRMERIFRPKEVTQVGDSKKEKEDQKDINGARAEKDPTKSQDAELVFFYS